MKRIPIAEACEGQVLARPVCQQSGSVLLQAGAVLTGTMVRRLRELGIAEVSIQGHTSSSEEEAAEAGAALDRRFAGHEASALMMALKAIISADLATPEGGDHATR
jgi:nicotinamide mononucleotide (NMN) deamidase PncC